MNAWAEFYSRSDVLQFLAGFGHAAAILLAGLTALAADRAILRAITRPPLRPTALSQLQRAHRRVFVGLSIALVTGLTMLSAQLNVLARSPLLWLKLALLGLLVWNGRRILLAERSLRVNPDDGKRWLAMSDPAKTSVALWLTIPLIGILLTTV